MSRLTDYEGHYCFMACVEKQGDENKIRENCQIYNNCYERKIYDKLCRYEEFEEQGRLVELPCKVGEEVWTVHKEWGIQHATYHRANRILLDVENGHVFMKTKEEAQAKWKEFRREKLAELKRVK